MAIVEEMTGGSSSSSKKKNKTLMYAGIGLAAGLVVLAMKTISGSSSGGNTPAVDSNTMANIAAGQGQQMTALGSQMQAFESAIEQSQQSVITQLLSMQQEQEAASTDTTTDPPLTLIGSSGDLSSAAAALAKNGGTKEAVNFINTDSLSLDQVRTLLSNNSSAYVVGSATKKGGVSTAALNGYSNLRIRPNQINNLLVLGGVN